MHISRTKEEQQNLDAFLSPLSSTKENVKEHRD